MNDDTKGTDGESVGSNDLLGGTAWLVEMLTGHGHGNYWCPRNESNWTTIDHAVRFSRKEDAERVILMLREHDRRSGRLIEYAATEHEWVPPNDQ